MIPLLSGLRRVAVGAALLLLALGPAPRADAARKPIPRIIKVLPHYLDLEGRHSINPSLFDRDAYQFELRQNPERRSGMRFDILWKTAPGAPTTVTLRLELRGSKAPAASPVIVSTRAINLGGFREWTRIPLVGEDYEKLGDLLAWRATLWVGEELISEQTSFLW